MNILNFSQSEINQAINAMKGMNQDSRSTLVTVVMAIVTNSRDVVETLHQNAPNDLACESSATDSKECFIEAP